MIMGIMKRRVLVLLPFLLASLTHAEEAPFDLKQLKAPNGFHIAVFANVNGPRLLTFTPGGILLVSESGQGKVVALPDPKQTGKAEKVVEVLTGLNEPHGIAFFEGKLYVATIGMRPTCGRPIPQRSRIYQTEETTPRVAFCFTRARCTFPPDQAATSALRKTRAAPP